MFRSLTSIKIILQNSYSMNFKKTNYSKNNKKISPMSLKMRRKNKYCVFLCKDNYKKNNIRINVKE